jgi:hypothetical protein
MAIRHTLTALTRPMPEAPMALMSERMFAQTITNLATSDPFLPEWIERERVALGHAFVSAGPVWQVPPPREDDNPNARRSSCACARKGLFERGMIGGYDWQSRHVPEWERCRIPAA